LRKKTDHFLAGRGGNQFAEGKSWTEGLRVSGEVAKKKALGGEKGEARKRRAREGPCRKVDLPGTGGIGLRRGEKTFAWERNPIRLAIISDQARAGHKKRTRVWGDTKKRKRKTTATDLSLALFFRKGRPKGKNKSGGGEPLLGEAVTIGGQDAKTGGGRQKEQDQLQKGI